MSEIDKFLYYEEENPSIKIYHGDCLEIMPLLENVDLVVTDPPYGIGYKPHNRRSKSTKHTNTYNTQEIYGETNGGFNPSSLLKYKNIILWGANSYAHLLPRNYGWLVWTKKIPNGFIASQAELAWTNFLNRVFVFEHLWHGLCRGSEIGKHYHPTQKPKELMKWCLKFKDGNVLDPFLGSGTTLVACKELNRNGIGIEISEKYCEIAKKRLKNTTKSLF